jgi:hypothetical protein
MFKRGRALALVLVLVAALASCSRGDEKETGGGSDDDTTDTTGGGSGDSRIAKGEFGDLGKVCQDGDPAGASDTGVTDSEIKIGTITDKTNPASPGLNEEMYDTAVAFAAWCNANGGINGRDVVIEDLDAKLFEYADRIAEACSGDVFALVGGGAVFDNADEGAREACGLPNLPGFVVTPEGRTAGLQVQPVPNPVGEFPLQLYQRVKDLHPDSTKMGIFYVTYAGVDTVFRQLKETVESIGFDVAYERAYQPLGEQGWPNFVQELQDADIQTVELIGEPVNMTNMLNAMQVAGWYPDVITMQPNMYDTKFIDEAKASAGGDMYLRSAYPPFDMADEEPALADYLELMQTYNESGKYPAALGAQSLSAFLLFAESASECGADLTRDCLLEKAAATTDWEAGGLHAPTSPGNETATRCGLILDFTTDGFVYDEEATQPDDGEIYNCDDANIYKLGG